MSANKTKTTSTLHEKPLICFIDFESEIVKSFTEKSFYCYEGYLGNLIKVPNHKDYHQHLLKLDYDIPDNLHEYDILLFDMSMVKTEDYDQEIASLDGTSGKTARALLSQYPEKIFNPKAIATSIISHIIKGMMDRQLLIIIFASKQTETDYQFADITSHGIRPTSNETMVNTNFYETFPFSSNKSGSKIKLAEKENALSNFLVKYLKSFKYESTFYHPKKWVNNKSTNDSNFVPLLLNDNEEIVSFGQTLSECTVLVFPQIENKKDFLSELFNNVLPELFPELFPHHSLFGWLENADYELPGQSKLNAERITIEEKYKTEVEANEKAILKLKNDYKFLRDLLSETGSELVSAVEEYMKWLGFPSVVNLDHTNPDLLEEDLQIDCGDKFLVVEVKGIGGTSTDKDCSQITKIKYRRAEERQKFDVFGLYIVNHQRYMPPKLRNNPPFNLTQINDAKLDKRGLLTTYDLFNTYFLIENGIFTKEEVRNQLFDFGLISLQPRNIISIGIANEVYKNGQVAIINLTNIEIKQGDIVFAKKGQNYKKLKIDSIMINEKVVDKVSNGEIGLSFNGKIEKKSEIFLQN